MYYLNDFTQYSIVIRRKSRFLMKLEDILAILLGIILGYILGFTKFDLPLPVRIHKVNVKDPMNATEIIEKHLWNCNEYDWLANDINKRWKNRSDCIGKPNYILCVVSFIEEKCYIEFDKSDIQFLIFYFVQKPTLCWERPKVDINEKIKSQS